MTKLVELYREGEMEWPVSCAKCGATEKLDWSEAHIGKVVSVRPNFITGRLAIRGKLSGIEYPVCSQHAQGLKFANLLTRKTLGLTFLRGFIYVVGLSAVPTVLIMFLVFIMSIINNTKTPNIPLEFVTIEFIFAGAFLAVISSFWKIPLRIVKQSDHSLTIKFRNDDYAEQFVRLNLRKIIK